MTSQPAQGELIDLASHPVIATITQAGGAAYLDEIPHSAADLAALRAATDLGLLIRSTRTFYQLPGADRRAVAARRFRGYLTCVSAARVYGYPTRDAPVRTHLALRHNHGIRSTRSRPTRAVRIHRERRLTPATVEGLPVVTPVETVARALMCPDVEDLDSLAILDSALNQQHVTVDRVRDLLTGQRAAHARHLLTQGDAHARSILETIVRAYLREAGMRVRAGVVIDGVGELDLLVEEVLDVETDGFEYHHTPTQIRIDHERDQALLARGIIPLRMAYEHVMAGREQVVGLVRAALAGAAGLEPLTPPRTPSVLRL